MTNNKLSPIKVYVPVKDQPEFLQDYVLLLYGDLDKYWKTKLVEQERFIFTKEELENILGDAFDAGFKRGFDQPNVLKPDGQIYPDSVEHIQSLF